jgi:hypothetical protein
MWQPAGTALTLGRPYRPWPPRNGQDHGESTSIADSALAGLSILRCVVQNRLTSPGPEQWVLQDI